MEIASNDGYLLQYFLKAGVPCLGIEPTANTAMAARERGVDTRELFFSRQTAKNLADEGWRVDLLLGNNVLAHVPDINDFVGGMPLVLKPEGVITLEFPHLLRLIQNNQFDTIYHEHYSYLSLIALQPVFERAGLRIFDIDQLQTHGGSLRIYACLNSAAHEDTEALHKSLDEEISAGMNSARFYADFSDRVRSTKRALLLHLIESKEAGKKIVGYGAAAKGNTLLNYCGIGSDFIDYVVDRNPAKQNRLLPGTRIPVYSPDRIYETKPDEVLILPWNIAGEVIQQMSGIREWGGRFVIPIPRVHLA
jgi:SAM-dependent methyltransferase